MTQIDILLKVLKFSFDIFIWVIPGMIIVNILLEFGLLKKMTAPVGKFFNHCANLPFEVAVAFVSSFGSSYTAGSMLVNMKEKGLLSDRHVFLSAMTFSLPHLIRELFTYYFPVIIPILGVTLGAIYITVHCTAILVKIIFVIVLGKLFLSNKSNIEKKSYNLSEERRFDDIFSILKRSILQTKKPLKKMLVTIPVTALIIFELNAFDVFGSIPVQAEKLGLPVCSTGCLIAYMTSTLTGLTSVAACIQSGEITFLEAVKTILWGSILASPIFLLRFSMTYYIGIYGPKLGTRIALTSFVLNEFVYIVFLIAVIFMG